jgi:hypothetical protein
MLSPSKYRIGRVSEPEPEGLESRLRRRAAELDIALEDWEVAASAVYESLLDEAVAALRAFEEAGG